MLYSICLLIVTLGATLSENMEGFVSCKLETQVMLAVDCHKLDKMGCVRDMGISLILFRGIETGR